MYSMPLFKTKLYQTGICIILLCIGAIAFGQMPPVPINTSSASVENEVDPCFMAPENSAARTLTIEITNNYPSDIALIDFGENDFSTDLKNTITSISYRPDGETNEGWPIWNPGVHYVTLYFSNDIQSPDPNHIFHINANIFYKNLTDKQYWTYEASGCFRAKEYIGTPKPGTHPSPFSNSLGFQSEKNSSHLVEVNFGQSESLKVAAAGSSVILRTVDDKNPISLYIVSVMNPTSQNVIVNNEYYPAGKHQINMPELETGLYQIIVTQGSQIERLKYMHTKE